MTTINLMPGAQSAFVESDALYPGYFAGRRGGKTVASVMKMMKYVQKNPGATGCITFPSLDDRDRIFMNTFKKFFGEGADKWWSYGKKDGVLTFANGCVVYLRTTEDPDRLRGMTLAFAGMDEVGTGNQWDAFKILQPAVSDENYPPQFWVTSTPNVDAAWVKRLWSDKVWPEGLEPLDQDEHLDYPIFHARTVDNFHLPPHIREKLVKRWGGTRYARQELEGEFLSSKGVRFADILDPDIHQRQVPPDMQWKHTGIAGLDFGGVDPWAIVEWRQDLSNRLWAVDEFYKSGADEYEIGKWCRDHGIKKVICDPNGISKDNLRAMARRMGLNMEPALIHATDGINRFRQRYNWWADGLHLRCVNHLETCPCPNKVPGIFISYNCPNLWSELMNLEAHIPRGKEDAENKWRPGSADHAYDAGAYGGSWRGFIKKLGPPVSPVQIVRAA